VTLSLISIVVGLAITAALSAQVLDQVNRGTFIPENYFWFFSIQTSIASIGVLVATGIIGLQTRSDSPPLGVLRAMIVTYAVLTGVIYNLLLRDFVASTLPSTAPDWPLEMVHVWVPIYLIADWLLNPHRARLSWWAVPITLIYPALWFAASIVRGELTGWYPYEFLDPTQTGGWIQILATIAPISALAVGVSTVLIVINRLYSSRR
jgi:hypothetical protein